MSASDDAESLDSSDSEMLNSSDLESLESSACVEELELIFEGASEEEATAIAVGAIAGGSIPSESSIWGGRRPGSCTIQRGYCSWSNDYLCYDLALLIWAYSNVSAN
jgi:hypothetical protein